jgi:hypothetical protein
MRKRSAEKDMRTNMTNAETNTAATVAAQGAHVAPERVSSKKVATRKKGALKGPKAGNARKTRPGRKTAKKARTKEVKTPRAESKGAKILALILRPKGATLAELAKLTGWQNHSIRGFLSGTVAKKMGLSVESTKREDGQRVYSTSK